MPIPYGRQTLDDSDIDAVVEVLNGAWLTQGPAIAEFERAVADRCDVRHAVAFSSGTAALHAAAWAAGLGPGDELVTSAITFAASANCAVYLGATPRFADIDPATWNVSPATVEAALTERTRGVIPVHFTGLPTPTAAIRELVGDDVTIIEDAAHSLGGSVDGTPVGSCHHADMAIFSFHPVKAIATGEGGMVTTRDERLRDRLLTFRNHGMTGAAVPGQPWLREQHELGFNYRLSDIHAALGRSQMRRLDAFLDARNEIAARYREWLAGVEAIELPPEPPAGDRHAYHLFVVRHRGGTDARLRLYEQLRAREILAQIHYLPVYLHPYYREQHGCQPGLCPAAEQYYTGCLSLPCFPTLSLEDQRRVVDAITEIVAS